MPSLFPLATWDLCDDALADALLVRWGHWLGGCNRPFGRQSFALELCGEAVAVAVSASTVSARCAGFARGEVVELARLCARPDRRDLTRVAMRLWRVTAPALWLAAMNRPDLLDARGWPWRVNALVSYANAARHKGHVYRMDGWRKAADVPGGVAGGGRAGGKVYEAKSVWVFNIQAAAQDVAGPSPERSP